MVFYTSLPAGSPYVDFPCSLRSDPSPSACRVRCSPPDGGCSNAPSVCASLFECDAILYPSSVVDMSSPSGGAGLFTVLHLPQPQSPSLLPHSLVSYKSSGSYADSSVVKSRTYVVNSYGGSGSKMLAGWLSDLPAQYVKTVKHMHDPVPPASLKAFRKPLNEATSQEDYRNRHIPGGWYVNQMTGEDIPFSEYDNFRYLYIVKEPVEGLVSRYCYGHCLHVGGECGTDEKSFPTLDRYAELGVDSMGLGKFYDNWTSSSPRGGKTDNKRRYPIVVINYHKLWDNLPLLMDALSLPREYASRFPPRSETVRNDETGEKTGKAGHSAATRRTLSDIYEPLRDKIRNMEAVYAV